MTADAQPSAEVVAAVARAAGGPAPEDVRPDASIFAPALAGYFCANAGREDIHDAPRVRHIQRQQARSALPWAARWLGLPLPDGPNI